MEKFYRKMKEKWIVSLDISRLYKKNHEFSIDKVFDIVLSNRIISGQQNSTKYLYGNISDLYSPEKMKDVKKAGNILLQKINEQKKIRIIGDYDVDGIMASYILHTGLKQLGAICDVEIPDRKNDGYGLNFKHVCKSYLDGIDTIITCDNGISAIEQIKALNKLEITTIITDHHEVSYSKKEDGSIEYIIPTADAVIDPKQKECKYPFKEICGAGVAFKLISYLYDKTGISEYEKNYFLEFVCIATISDIMDLKDENRIFVKEGLKRLRETENIGLRALISKNKLEVEKIDVDNIAFILGPCLNACGRLDSADIGIQLLETEDKTVAENLAKKLKYLNVRRKEITAKYVDEAIKLVDLTGLKEDRVLVVYLPNCHESIAGLVAGKLKEYYNKPSFVLTYSGYKIKGSGRSIETYSMYNELYKCKECFTKFGGHQMAAGISLKDVESISVFRKRINEVCELTKEDFDQNVYIDAHIPIQYLNIELVLRMNILSPFGNGNKKPTFMALGLKVLNPKVLGRNKNVVKMIVSDNNGYKVDAIYFGDAEKFINYVKSNTHLQFVYYPSINKYFGKSKLQITITNYK